MAKKAKTTAAQVKPDLKQQAEEDLPPCDMPPEAHIPNAVTREAIRRAQTGEGLTEYASLDELKARFE